MPFCQNCGTEYNNDAKFCAGCGKKVGETNNVTQNKVEEPEEVILWEGKPASVVDKMKGQLNTVDYTVTNERIIIKWGLVGKKQEEIELIRIEDVSVRQSLTEKLQGIGKVIVISKDKTTPTIEFENVEDPHAIKEIIRKASKEEKAKLGYRYGEVY